MHRFQNFWKHLLYTWFSEYDFSFIKFTECNIWQIGIERISAIRLLQLTVYSDLSNPPLTQYQPLIQACCQLSFQVKTGFHHTVFLVTFYKIFQNTLCKEHQ